MVAELITQCPKCQTSFKVKDEQLKVANGLVRCGSCLHVFNAVEFSAMNSDAPVPPKLNEQEEISIDDLFEQDTLSQIDQNVDLTDDSVNEFISSSDDSDSDDEDFLSISDDDFSTGNDDNEFDADTLFGGEPLSSELSTPIKESNEDDWAEKLLEELGASDDSLDDSLLDPTTPASRSGSENTPIATKPGKTPPQGTPKAIDAQTNSTSKAVKKSPSEVKQQPTAKSPSRTVEESTEHDAVSSPSHNPQKQDDELTVSLDNQPMEIVTQETHQAPYIESEPVYLSTETARSKKELFPTIAWGFASFIACLAIIFQIAWLNFNTWSKLPELRSGYTIACALLDCKLPDIKALNKVRASNLIVRSDSKNPNHLLIDAIITNQASFSQPFPKLALIFTDNNGKVVASGLIHPSEYLGGELSGATIMEKNIPIHVAFKIEDPGSNARSYRLEFFP